MAVVGPFGELAAIEHCASADAAHQRDHDAMEDQHALRWPLEPWRPLVVMPTTAGAATGTEHTLLWARFVSRSD